MVTLARLNEHLRAFGEAKKGNVAITFALALLPILTGVGMAIDYSRASATRTSVQDALDSALLAGAKDGSSAWATTAANIFKSNLESKSIAYSEPSFSKSDPYFVASVNASVPTSILGIVGINSVSVTANSKAVAAPDGDNSCILTLDKGQSKTDVSLRFNGAPNVSLSSCSIRSNTSLTCNGHDGNAIKSIAAGSASSCSNPVSNATVVPDTYSSLATNITKQCGLLKTGVPWTPGTIPTGTAVKLVSKAGYTEYHICGDLTLSGSGSLFGASPASDAVIVVENGSIILGNNAAITSTRTAFVMTGDNTSTTSIQFPNGNGKAASFTVSPPTNTSNPWQAVSIYLDPALTANVDNDWGPGATFNADGLVYLGNSNVTTRGNSASSNSKCTKFVVNSFTTNGSINLNFSQQNCTQLGLKQWDGGGSVRLTQ